MRFWLSILLFVGILWLLIYLLKWLVKRSRYARYDSYITRTEYLIWLVLGNWLLFSLLPQEARIAYILPISLSLLVLYLYQEWVSGWLFRGFYPIQEGQQIKVGQYQGQIAHITSRYLTLKQAKGELILPYARLLWKPVWYGQAQQKNSNRHRFQFYPAKGEPAEELRARVQQRIWLHPAVLPKPAPAVHLTETEQGTRKLEVWLTLLPGYSVAEVETFLITKN